MSKLRRIDSAVLAELRDVPPLAHMGTTADQQALWHDVRRGISIVRSMLEAYFSGKGANTILDGMKPCDRRMYEAITAYYIAFYDLLWWHWEDICKAADHNSDFPKEPGEACLLLIKIEVAAMITTSCQPYSRYSIKGHRETSALLRKIDSNAAIGHQDPALSKRLRKLTQFDDYLKPFFKFKMDVITVCRTGKRSKQQRLSLKRFLESEADKQAATEASLHPRNKVKGWEWREGVQSQIS
jgi:hypothetical protein